MGRGYDEQEVFDTEKKDEWLVRLLMKMTVLGVVDPIFLALDVSQ